MDPSDTKTIENFALCCRTKEHFADLTYLGGRYGHGDAIYRIVIRSLPTSPSELRSAPPPHGATHGEPVERHALSLGTQG